MTKNGQKILKVIETEPEPAGPMPDCLWDLMRGNRVAVEEAIRAQTRATKKSITRRLINLDLV